MFIEDGKKYFSWNKLREDGLSLEKVEEIKSLPKSKKPLPESCLSKNYIDEHLSEFKNSGSVKIMSNTPLGTIGCRGGTFVMSNEELEEIIKYANGDISKIESLLKLEKGYLGDNPMIVKFDETTGLRMPRGNELGAYPELWEPGGFTGDGIKEAVIDPALEGTYTYEYLFK